MTTMTDYSKPIDAPVWGVFRSMTLVEGNMTRAEAEDYAAANGGYTWAMPMQGPHEAHWFRRISPELREELSPDVRGWKRAQDVARPYGRRIKQKYGAIER